MSSRAVVHPPACPDCGASLSLSVDDGFSVVGVGASGVAIGVVRWSNPHARYRTEAVPGAVLAYPTRCGCGARWALRVRSSDVRLELEDEVEWGESWPDPWAALSAA